MAGMVDGDRIWILPIGSLPLNTSTVTAVSASIFASAGETTSKAKRLIVCQSSKIKKT